MSWPSMLLLKLYNVCIKHEYCHKLGISWLISKQEHYRDIQNGK